MNRWFPRVVFALTLLFVSCTRAPQPKPFDVSPERKATHMVTYYEDGHRAALCTATAIGPHALMTAHHCNKDAEFDTMRIDLMIKDYHIQDIMTDDRDHDIYLTDATFTNFVPYKVRDAKMGEHVRIYGDGEGDYPSHKTDGTRVPIDDPSDLDQDAGIVKFSNSVISGDSGSAVWADDGSIVAVTTYLWDDKETGEKATIDFTPAFTKDQIDRAVHFTPDPDWQPEEKEKPPVMRHPSIFDLFTGR